METFAWTFNANKQMPRVPKICSSFSPHFWTLVTQSTTCSSIMNIHAGLRVAGFDVLLAWWGHPCHSLLEEFWISRVISHRHHFRLHITAIITQPAEELVRRGWSGCTISEKILIRGFEMALLSHLGEISPRNLVCMANDPTICESRRGWSNCRWLAPGTCLQDRYPVIYRLTSWRWSEEKPLTDGPTMYCVSSISSTDHFLALTFYNWSFAGKWPTVRGTTRRQSTVIGCSHVGSIVIPLPSNGVSFCNAVVVMKFVIIPQVRTTAGCSIEG